MCESVDMQRNYSLYFLLRQVQSISDFEIIDISERRTNFEIFFRLRCPKFSVKLGKELKSRTKSKFCSHSHFQSSHIVKLDHGRLFSDLDWKVGLPYPIVFLTEHFLAMDPEWVAFQWPSSHFELRCTSR
jgi:hypothetical protein